MKTYFTAISIVLMLPALGQSETLKDTTTMRSSGVLNVVPNGTFRAATGSSAVLNTPTLLPQVNGFGSPNQLYLLNDVGSVASFSANYGSIVDNFHPKPNASKFSATGATFATELSAQQVSNIQAMIAQNAELGNPVGVLALSSDGLLGNITAISTTGVTVGNWMAPGNSAAGQVPSGKSVQLNAQQHVWAQNVNVTLPKNSITPNGTGIEGDFINQKAAAGAAANIVGVTMNCHDGGLGFGCNSGFIASGIKNAPWSAGFVSSKNTIGFQSIDSSNYGFAVLHGATSPSYGFVSYQATGNPFAYNPGNTGFAWSVSSNGGMSLGNPAVSNGYAVAVGAAGTSPRITATGVDANIDLELRGKGTGSVKTVGELTVGTNAVVTGAVKAASYTSGAKPGVSCAAGTVSLETMVVTNGIITHC